MHYIAVRWHHSIPSEPIELFSELDDTRREIRKVEVFSDGTCHSADQHRQSGPTRLGVAPVPSLEEIGSDRQFSPREIKQSDFEEAWRRACGGAA